MTLERPPREGAGFALWKQWEEEWHNHPQVVRSLQKQVDDQKDLR